MLVRIPGVTLLEEIGCSGRSVAYRAVRGDDVVTVKTLRDDGPGPDDRTIRRFYREAGLQARVRHPGLASVLEVGECEGRPYLMFEYLEGRTLVEHLADGPLPEARAVAIARGIAVVLAEIHRHGLVHRDLKPDNVIIDRNGSARVIDFGFATRAGTADAEVAGTFLYAAPEQTGMLKRPVDGRSDLYALGALLFECVAGHPPFTGGSVGELLRRHAAEPAPPLPNASPALAAVVARLLAKDPDDRYQSARGLLSDLDRLERLNAAIRVGGEAVLGTDDDPLEARHAAEMVGRDAELNLLTRAWRDALQGRGGAVLVEGAAGSGKSRLLKELARGAREIGAPTLVATAGDPTPLAPIRDWLEGYLAWIRRLPPLRRGEEEARIVRAWSEAAPLLRRLSPDLARLLPDVSGAAPEAAHDVLAEAIMRIAEGHRGLLLVLEDVPRLDEASRRVLRRLELAGSSVLLLMSAREAGSERSAAGLRGEASRSAAPLQPDLAGPAVRVRLQPLADDEVRRLVAARLGSADPELAERIASRCGGNPLAAEELLLACLEGGYLRPHHGRWLLVGDTLPAAGGVESVVLDRLRDLEPAHVAVLQAAAISAAGLSPAVLAAACGVDEAEVDEALAEATARTLLERVRGEHRFVHDRIRETLAEAIPAERLRDLHGRMAEALERTRGSVYAIAHHHARAHHDPRKICETSTAAGLAAVAAGADDDARLHLERAWQTGLAADARVPEALGGICFRTGRLAESIEYLRIALDRTPDRVERAALRGQMAKAHLASYGSRDALGEVMRAFGELKRRAPRRDAAAIIPALWSVAKLAATGGTRRVPPPLPAETRREREVIYGLWDLCGHLSYFEVQPFFFLHSFFGAVLSGYEAGRSPELVQSRCRLATVLGLAGRREASARLLDQAEGLAGEMDESSREGGWQDPGRAPQPKGGESSREGGWQDPGRAPQPKGGESSREGGWQDPGRAPQPKGGGPWLRGHVRVYRALAVEMVGDAVEAEAVARACLQEDGRRLDSLDFRNLASSLVSNLVLRGRFLEAWQWLEHALKRTGDSDDEWNILVPMAGAVLALLGRPVDGAPYLRRVRALVESEGEVKYRRSWTLQHLLLFELAQGRADDLNRLLALHDGLRIPPALMPHHLRPFLVFAGYARVRQGRGLREAVARLRRAPMTPALACHRAVLEAGLADDDRALRLLGEADALAARADSPWAEMEAAALRAGIFRRRGWSASARREAERALALARACGWMDRARRLRAEFGLGGTSGEKLGTVTNFNGRGDASAEASPLKLVTVPNFSPVPNFSASGSSDLGAVRVQRQLDVLLAMSGSWGSVLDPDEVGRRALDQAVGLLGAERGFLFLVGERGLAYAAGRDAGGASLAEPSGYSRTVVDQVWESGQPLLVSGTEEGEVLGSQSVVTHDIRSIVAAPLKARDRVAGVLYLDSRLARGVFGGEDVGLLCAVAGFVAAALETARAARLEVGVETERQQRLLAESLGELGASTLDVEDVFRRLLDCVSRFVPFQAAAGGVAEGARVRIVAAVGTHPPGEELAESLSRGAPEPRGGGLAIPLMVQGQASGLLWIARPDGDPFEPREADVAFALAGQAGIALENARLFAEVRRLATTDGLTGLNNRRQFMALAEREIERARRQATPLWAMMLDVDHFKSFNDRHGHQVGDQVLARVAECLRAGVRAIDVAGRYGGEEFAAIVGGTLDETSAFILAERLRARIEEAELRAGAEALRVTVSVGLAGLRPDEGLEGLLRRADEALYASKSGGRNQVTLA